MTGEGVATRVGSRVRRSRGEAGFTLLALVVAIAVVNIALGVAVTRWSFTMKRHREAELIWRGEKYAQALSCYQQAQGAPPTRLEELVEERCIRRLYEDPMSESGEWRVLRVADLLEERGDGATGGVGLGVGAGTVPAGEVVSESGQGLRARLDRSFSLDRERSAMDLSSDRSGLPDRSSLRERVGVDRGPGGESRGREGRPSRREEMDGIVGVVSTSDEESIRPRAGGRHYSDWRFMVGSSVPEVPMLPGLSGPAGDEASEGQPDEAVPAGSESGSGLRERVRRSGRGSR